MACRQISIQFVTNREIVLTYDLIKKRSVSIECTKCKGNNTDLNIDSLNTQGLLKY